MAILKVLRMIDNEIIAYFLTDITGKSENVHKRHKSKIIKIK